jgi:hypothetical protein
VPKKNLLTCAWLATTPFVPSAFSAVCVLQREQQQARACVGLKPSLISSQRSMHPSDLAARLGEARHTIFVQSRRVGVLELSSCGARSTHCAHPAQRTSCPYWHWHISATPVGTCSRGIQHLCGELFPTLGGLGAAPGGKLSPRRRSAPLHRRHTAVAPTCARVFGVLIERGASQRKLVCVFSRATHQGFRCWVVTGHRESKGRASWSRPHNCPHICFMHG